MANYIFEDVNEALPVVLRAITTPIFNHVFSRESRNGPVHEFYRPVVISYTNPSRRVLLNNTRAANPFFHFFEAMWMLAGRDDVAWLSQFLVRMKDFSDNGQNFHGAYGKRWWTNNNLLRTIEKLRKDKDTRRAFLPIAHYDKDVAYGGLDMPCNTGVSFYIRDGRLDMSVFNRSNDLLLGALGANYVHFGFLQEFVASMVGVPVGIYSQVSSCMHLYLNDPVTKRLQANPPQTGLDTYEAHQVKRTEIPLMSSPIAYPQWYADLQNFMQIYTIGDKCLQEKYFWFEPFFENIAAPMFRAWYHRKAKRKFRDHISQVQALDWQYACCQWYDRREARQHGEEQAAD